MKLSAKSLSIMAKLPLFISDMIRRSIALLSSSDMTFPSKVMAWLKDLSIYQYLIKKHITGLFRGLNEGHFTGLATLNVAAVAADAPRGLLPSFDLK